ncbi:hypothetical protein C2S51_001854 [Perilla frutescens var. frutescens]|nr:hypothetical protein C2S51_001854 [Perilla frutescens var. frutescens]
MTNLTDEWKHEGLRKAAVVVSLQDGTSEFLQIFFAFLADAYTGRFTMLACSTTLCVAGLLLSLVSAWKAGHLDVKLFYPALLVMALSEASKEVTLKAFLGDQLVPRDSEASEDVEERAKKSCNFWWTSACFLATIVALFGASRIDSLRDLLILLAGLMGASLLWFLLGIRFYSCTKPTGSSLSDVVSVIHSAVVKRKVVGDIRIPPDVSCLRWLDKAAAVEIENPKQTEQFACSVEQVKGVKFLIKMVPMWTTFLIFCLVSASGRTFFLQEARSITGHDFPILVFIIFPKVVESVVSGICIFLLKKLGYKAEENTTQRMKLVRIGLGMLCCVPCCIVAWINAVHRLQFPAKHHRKLHNYTSLVRLFPQFFLLELMKRLSTEGLEQFFDSQVSKSISRYGPQFGECVIGVGKFWGVMFILSLSKWFGWFEDTVSLSHLENYYMLLAGLSFINFIAYYYVACWYGEDTFLCEEEDGTDDVEMAISEGAVVAVPLESRSLSGKGKLSARRRVPRQEEGSSGDYLKEKSNTQSHERSMALETAQENVTVQNGDDVELETETSELDVIDQTYQDSSPSALEDAANAPLLVERERSISRVSSMGIHKRLNSMRLIKRVTYGSSI